MKFAPFVLPFVIALASTLLPQFGFAQSFDETWKEFLEERQVSRISALRKPDKNSDSQDYAKYLLMNANSRFCQNNQEEAERLTTELLDMGTEVYTTIPGFAPRLEFLQTSYGAYYFVDSLWSVFLNGGDVAVDVLESAEDVKQVCEKATAAKYSYMLAYGLYCGADIERSRMVFENRTLRLAEATTLKIEDVRGLPARVKTMKTLFAGLEALDKAWATFVKTGESPGFSTALPEMECYLLPNLKAYILQGSANLCGQGPEMLAKINAVRASSDAQLSYEVRAEIKKLEEQVGEQQGNVAELNKAWGEFMAKGEVSTENTYGYTFCDAESSIRAYILDGYTFVCSSAPSALIKIESLRRQYDVKLDDVTESKIDELAGLYEQYQKNGTDIEEVWRFFVVNDDALLSEYQSSNQYCDNIQDLKDWTIRGLTADCNDKVAYLAKIEETIARIEFKLFPDLECRVQKLRIQLWDCRYNTLTELAELESSEGGYDARLAELMAEYAMPERPEVCVE